MFQRLAQWVLDHLKGVVLTTTLASSFFLVTRSSQMDFGPIRRSLLYVVSTGQRAFSLPIRLVELDRENRYLRTELRSRVTRGAMMEKTLSENERLREMLDFRRTSGLNVLAARVLSHDADVPPTSCVIDVGSLDGVRPFDPIVSPLGLVGRVENEASWHSSVARLLTDPGLRTSVTIANASRPMGIVRWDGEAMRVENVPQESSVTVGDPVVTSGMGGLFPKGLFVGTVDSVREEPHALFKYVALKPGARLDRLEEVFLIRSVSDTARSMESPHALDR